MVHRLHLNKFCTFYKISVLDDFGGILMTFAVNLSYADFDRIFVTDEKNPTFVKIGFRSVE